MALILVATAGASDANSYATRAEADAYHEARLHADAWTVSDGDKERALVMATRLLDSLVTWTGAASGETQALAWPRSGMLTRNGYGISSTIIPQALKDATAEFARQLLTEDRSLDNDVEANGLTQLKAGPVELKFKEAVVRKALPDAVIDLLPESWIAKSSTVIPFKAF